MDTTVDIQLGNRTIYATVTANSNTIANWIDSVTTFFRNKRTVVFGLDINWRPKRGPGPLNPVATLQICAGNRCLIIQMNRLHRIPQLLAEFLANPRYLFAVVETRRDSRKLDADYGLQIHDNMYDLRKEALGKCPDQRLSTRPGLKELASVVAGIYLEKPRCICSGDWDLECLSYRQVEYACLDAYACCRIGVTLFLGYQWACSPSTCAYIECQEHVVSPEISDYEEEYEERTVSSESSDYYPPSAMDTIFNIRINGATIHTSVTSYSSTITDWIQTTNNTFEFFQSAIFGLDVEWKPHTRGVQNPVATLQICADNRCLIIQLLHLDRIPPSLRRFLTNPRYNFAGVEIAADAQKLESQLGLICRNLYDLREEALQIWPERLSRCPGLKELARKAAGIYLEKPKNVTLSNWEDWELDEDQVEYACLDAYASSRVGIILFYNYDWYSLERI